MDLCQLNAVKGSLIALLLLPCASVAQPLVPELLTALPTQLNETSGLLVLGNEVWTVLDSGAPAAIYQVDPQSGAVLRTVALNGATNVDFEEITADEQYVYVADIGNNFGSRTDLIIYRSLRSDLVGTAVSEVQTEAIHFELEDQTDFTPALDATNFDCEALVAMDDSLFLFTKRWLDRRSQVYALPATPGDHVARVRGQLEADGLITAAAWDGNDRLVLLGHEDDPGQPFVWIFNGVQDHDFFGAAGVRREVDLFDHQTEGIAWYTPDEWLLSNEQGFGFPAALWSVDVLQTVAENGRQHTAVAAFPLPASDQLRISGLHGSCVVRVFEGTGKEVLRASVPAAGVLHLEALGNGSYVALVADGDRMHRLPFVVMR